MSNRSCYSTGTMCQGQQSSWPTTIPSLFYNLLLRTLTTSTSPPSHYLPPPFPCTQSLLPSLFLNSVDFKHLGPSLEPDWSPPDWYVPLIGGIAMWAGLHCGVICTCLSIGFALEQSPEQSWACIVLDLLFAIKRCQIMVSSHKVGGIRPIQMWERNIQHDGL